MKKLLATLFSLSLSSLCYASQDSFVSDLADEINALRARYNMSPVAIEPLLDCAAVKLAQDIAPKNLCQYVGSDGSTVLDHALSCGTRAWAQLVGCGYLDAKSVVAAWAGRLDGSKVIFDPTLTRIGTSRVLNHFVVVLN